MNKHGNYEMDMTSGPLLRKIIIFACPLIATGFLQLLYNAADIAIVGRFDGKEALAAVGSTTSLINLLINLFFGISVGTSVTVARQYGARDVRGVTQTVHTSVTLALIGGVTVGALGFFLSRPLLELMGSPEDVINGAATYVRIYFLGMPLNMLYTFGAAIMRAVGDTKRPLYFLTISGVINVLMNLLFVIVFRMGVAGVAIATVISQGVSMTLVLRCLMHTDSCVHLNAHMLKIRREPLISIMRIGLPAGLQASLFSLSNVFIQSSVNSFGSVAMAGNAAGSNLEGFVNSAMNSVYQADMTFAGQNMGAKRYDRVWRTLWLCLSLVTAVTFAMGVLFTVFGGTLLKLYTTDPQVIGIGLMRMRIICILCFTCGIMDVLSGQLRAMGYALLPMLVTLSGACAFRIVWIYTVFARSHTLETLYWSYPVSWTITSICHLLCFFVLKRRVLKRAASEGGLS